MPLQRSPRFKGYNHIPALSKVRRAPNSPSFRKTSAGEYTIIKDGKKIHLQAFIKNSTQNGFSIILNSQTAGEIGRIGVHTSHFNTNFHRHITGSYRGYNLGKLLFRLSEQEVKKRGGEKVRINTMQQDTITIALSLGYAPTKEGAQNLKYMLQIPQTEALPKTQELIKRLKEKPIKNYLLIELEKKLIYKEKLAQLH